MERDLMDIGLQLCVLLAGFFGGMNFAFWLRRPDQDTAVCARRYRWLRARPLDSIIAGGIFIGVTGGRTGGWVINGDDADRAVDAAMEVEDR